MQREGSEDNGDDDGEISDISEESVGFEEELELLEAQLEKEVHANAVSGPKSYDAVILESAKGPTVHCLEPELPQYKCDSCTKTFHELKHLVRHIETHNRWRFRCELCGAYLKTKASLCKHQQRHSVEKRHQCEVCWKGFSTNDGLQVHRKLHQESKPRYRCDVCGKDFGRVYTLRDHMKLHDPEPEHRCERCSKVFPKRRQLLLHARTHLVQDSLDPPLHDRVGA
ncbi:zinc finger protein 226-like [Anopheles aquasalis]|uniref:zinc finger protein 226-like n=1 Tax=Anopheles aquasalis TaxID=42839 RepID=UPI00215A9AB7|nr:zinc finger protein 226-like [Anopheles aquasalis]